MHLQPHETELEGGAATFDGHHTHADPVCHRIDWLTMNYLEKIASHPSEAATTLFRDPADGRFWERTYPHQAEEGPGDGPPSLHQLSEEAARERYRL